MIMTDRGRRSFALCFVTFVLVMWCVVVTRTGAGAGERRTEVVSEDSGSDAIAGPMANGRPEGRAAVAVRGR